MSLAQLVKAQVKRSRKKRSSWVRLLDKARLTLSAEGRSVLWTTVMHPHEVHQTTSYTNDDRYPELFDFVAALSPGPERILSFGCSTGEELLALRSRFPGAVIVGAEINSRSRRIARQKTANDPRTSVCAFCNVGGSFDLVFALAVLQREPHKIAEMDIQDLSLFYPFRRFDAAVRQLEGMLRLGGFLCVVNAQYRVEDSSSSVHLTPDAGSPVTRDGLYGTDGQPLRGAAAHWVFRKTS